MKKDIVSELQKVIRNVPVRSVTVPEGLSVHELHMEGGDVSQHIHTDSIEEAQYEEITPEPVPVETGLGSLEVIHDSKLLFRTEHVQYYILGSISQELESLTVMLMAEDLRGRKERMRIDLYDRETIRKTAEDLAGSFELNPEAVDAGLLQLTDALEKHRDTQLQKGMGQFQSKRNYLALSPENRRECVAFLSAQNLIGHIDHLISQTGIVGEENTRMMLFIIASTYRMNDTLHALVQGTSSSGKSHLINGIARLMPPEDVLSMTRISSKSLYHYGNDELMDKLILVQDWDGLDDEAQYAFRELQSAGNISSSITYKDKNGQLTSTIKTVRSRFASMLATTKAEIYFDNATRSLAIGVDESDAQTQRIIDYQNRKLAGLIEEKEEHTARVFLQNCIRAIAPKEVINMYADKIKLPIEAKTLRRLNNHYQAFVKQITILHQHQRKTDDKGRLITQPEDLRIACDLLFDTIMIKIDDLDASLRQFFESLKAYAGTKRTKEEDASFSQREARLALNISKTQCFRFFEELTKLEYIQKVGGHANKGYKYKIIYHDDMEKARKRIKEDLQRQLKALE
jgi:energy-coupling factor transporter ATP-binding protein EcfA2